MMKIKLKHIFRVDVINSQTTLFAFLSQMDDNTPIFPLTNEFINGDNQWELGFDYFGFSSEKYISPLLFKLFDEELKESDYEWWDIINDTIPLSDLNQLIVNIIDKENGHFPLGTLIYNRFSTKWKRIWDALNTQYNPLENYSMLEERTPDLTKEQTFDTTDERTPDLTTTTHGTNNSESGVYGFNSTNSNPSNDGVVEIDNTEDLTGTDINTKSGTITESETGKDTLTRSGNIGVTTSQQMLQSEFEVRKYDFYKQLFIDIDSILCLKSY